ncbi:tripartite tricarboxylate transporter TctB family protein [Cereibacter sphaeroides]|nr:tripartite tricarboxylate transporter TctB family protein [Cereibacter sphaeroides]
MNRFSSQNLLAAGLALAVAAIGLYGAWSMDLGSLRRIGQGAFPQAVSLLLLLMGLGVFALRAEPGPERPALRPIVFVSAAMIAFALLLPLGGLGIAVVAATALCACASSESRVVETFGLGVLLAAGFAGLFVYGLGLNIPLLPE